jgi:hypothetical protein
MKHFDPDKIFFFETSATLKEFEPSEELLKASILAAIEKASKGQEMAEVSPVGSNNKPRMLQLSGWITFADEMNKNGRMFTHADLEEAVAGGMFKAPFLGMIDYNHDFQAYGVWYDAKFALDEVSGKWGIYSEGVMFAWRYTELADKMLAMQARNGHIDLSMAALPEWYEPGKDSAGNEGLIARKPVFFTTSLLDVDPAFPNARAAGSEDPESTPEKRAAQLLKSSLTEASPSEESMKIEGTEVKPNEESLETVEETKVEAAAAPEAKAEEVTPEAPKVEAATEEPKTEVEVVPEVKAPEARVTELESELATARVALSAAETMVTNLTAERDALQTYKNEIEQAKAAVELAKRREIRMTELSEVVKAEMEKEENKPLLEEWMGYDEARWEATKKVFAVASTARKSMADKTREEGVLSGTSDKAEGSDWAISRHVKRS